MEVLSEARELQRLRLEEHGLRWLAYTHRRMKDSCRAFNEHMVKCGIADGRIHTSL